MICSSCRTGHHEQCPNKAAAGGKSPTGLNEELDRIQRSGLCACQHRVRPLSLVRSDIGTEFVQQVDAAADLLADVVIE